MQANKTWSCLSRDHKIQLFQNLMHLKNELGILEVKILQLLQTDGKIRGEEGIGNNKPFKFRWKKLQ